jgi:predicted acetyltransferase
VDVTLRWCDAGDLPDVMEADGRAFGFHYEADDLDDKLRLHDPTDFLVAEDDGRVVGLTDSFPFDMTLPGGAGIAVRGVSWVSVQPTHRRRGILTALMREQHERFVADGVAVAVLTASEGGIYGRFGYGPATLVRKVELDRRLVSVRRDLPDAGPVQMVTAEEARSLLPERFERWRLRTPGGISRGEAYWTHWFLDKAAWRGSASKRFYAVHDDGYVAYRRVQQWHDGLPAHDLEVDDLFTASEAGHRDLWRFLLGIDLVGKVTVWDAPLDDPLPFLVDNPRGVRTTALLDGLWVRLLDVPVALAARSYAVPGELVLDVRDDFLSRGGRVRLRGGPDGATCTPSTDEPDLALGVGALGSLYLGAHRATTLARAGLVEERSSGALARADLLFGTERQASYGTPF